MADKHSVEFLKANYPDQAAVGTDPSNDWSSPRIKRDLWSKKADEAREFLSGCGKSSIPQHVVDEALKGNLLGKYIQNDVPVITLFLSSTFTDTADERDILILDVYPFLKHFARSVGVEFYQPAEMRWGIRKESADAHLTSAICMNEIKRCQVNSCGLNHVLILGDKYGYRPFPTVIPQAELEALIAQMDSEGLTEAADLARTWYKLDQNVIPAEYVLQPKGDIDGNAWWGIFEKLQLAFRRVAHVLPGDRAELYTISVTHEETIRGIIARQHSPTGFYTFFRDIQGIREHYQADAAKKYIDIAGGAVDEDAQKLLAELRDHILPKNLPEGRFAKTQVPWAPAGITLATHTAYLRDFADEFCSLVLQNIVDVASKSGFVMEEVYEEAVQHIKFCKTKSEGLTVTDAVGKVIQRAVDYVSSDISTPLVIHGRSGSGKTSIMAACAYEVQKQNPNANLIIRFLGTTSGSGSSRGLLAVLLPHLKTLYAKAAGEGEGDGDADEIPSEYNQQIAYFHSLLQRVPADRPLVLMLDSLDQLSDDDNGRKLGWMPLAEALPENVKIIVSTLPDVGDCYPALRAAISDENQFIGVLPMSVDDGETILHGWLTMEKRNLTDQQKQVIISGFQENKSPLYLKIAFEDSLNWKSYYSAPVLGVSVRQLILDLFANLERIHGRIFVSAALGLLTVARSGLSTNEIEDVLSCDDEVLDDVFEWWTPPIRRVPPLLWKRLRGDLERYVVQRGADGGIPVVQFYHRQFWEASGARYLESDSLRKSRHAAIADYFQGVWAGKLKPYGKNLELLADRQVPAQPLVLNGVLGQNGSVINMRRLGEEVYNRMHAEQYEELIPTLSDIEYVWAKSLAGQVPDMVREYVSYEVVARAALEKGPNPLLDRIVEFSDWAQSNAHILTSVPHIFIQQTLFEPSTSDIYALGVELEKKYREYMGVYAKWSNKITYKNPVALIIPAHTTAVSSCAFSPDGEKIATTSDDSTVRVFDATTGQQLLKLKPATEKASTVTFSPDGSKLYSGGQNKKMDVWDAKTGTNLGSLGTNGWVLGVAVSPDGQYVAACSSFGFVITNALGARIADATGVAKTPRSPMFSMDGRLLFVGGGDGAVYMFDTAPLAEGRDIEPAHVWAEAHKEPIYGVAVSPDSKWVASASSDMFVQVFDVESKEKVHTITNGLGKMYTVAFSPDCKYLLAAGGGTKCVEIHRTSDWTRLCALRGHSDVVWRVSFSPSGDRILSCGGSLDKSIRVWDTEYSLSAGEPTGHASVAREVAWHPDSTKVVSCGDDNIAQIYDVSSAAVIRKFEGFKMKLSASTISPDGKHLLVGGAEAILKLFNAETGELVQTITEGDGGHPKPILSIVWRDDRTVWTTGNGFIGFCWKLVDEPSVHLEKVFTIKMKNAGFDSQWSKDGSFLVTRYDKGCIASIDAEHGKVESTYFVSTEEGVNTISVAIHANNKLIAAGSNTGKIYLWTRPDESVRDVESPPMRQPFMIVDAHASKTKDVSFSPNGKYLATGSDDKSIAIWDTQTWKRVATIPTLGAIQSCAFSPNGNMVAAADFAGIVYFYELIGLETGDYYEPLMKDPMPEPVSSDDDDDSDYSSSD
eukprot:TRINITY_DN1676_c0_g1::TRINITY_DN1676_c0_g1_i2::g.17883::m.17883 TRINITY_DN1676_c0_g1::TRINITY_DN1676_c0_g1_i2::g.17883  ORF type:complete len:1613 (+),score=581.39,sp/Q149M9/NWD1_HUMAN/24.96/2e-79,WD40/PF00400.27/5.8e-09,WD40/PF00400.27/0.65,WD40/PF00400.27/0.16,WD40/PF00400.27/73,WD40/PF00400.27/0.00016,WD40/PF00400.27/7,WD40/PF00400.27/6.3e-07,WD40/PF00400.27/0.0015,WD40/PF00400.27/2.1e+02,WD40/PF00400.27/2.5e+02,WD40/PF00400.27/4.8,WD40/PF00400.27/4.9e-08,WD40/PF00400.27/7.5,eIF2A/PF08662.6/0